MDDISDDTTARRRPSCPGRSPFARPSSPSSPPPATPPQQHRPFNLQNRRLQLRNAGFRGARLIQRRISPQVPGWGGDPDENKENIVADGSSPWEPDLTTPSRSHRTSSILQEIGRSTQRRGISSPRPSVAALFQSSPRNPSTQLSPSIFPDPDTEAVMEPGDDSSSSRNPFPSLERPKRRREVSSRVSQRDTSRYIEHLESQLAASLDRAETVDSSSSAVHSSKIKSLTAELRVLKKELSEWESRFEDRVQDELGSMVERESHFRARIRTLEKDAELKENRIREVEWEVEMGNRRLRNMDAVKSTNRSLERRVDVLTGLLAQSPTKTDVDTASRPGYDVTSPESDPSIFTPRPKSMFSKIPLSPVRRPLFQSPTEPQSITGILEETSTPPSNDLVDSFTHSRQPSGFSVQVSDLDSGLGESCSLPSTRAPESQRSSMISHSSSASSHWPTSFPLSPDLQGKFQSRHKRMRCFPSGSSTLKPLVLPATTATSPPSGSISSQVNTQEPPSQGQLDGENDDLFLCQSASPSSHEDTLKALEGDTSQYQTFEEAISGHTMSETLETSLFGDETRIQQDELSDRDLQLSWKIRNKTEVGSVRRSRRCPPQSSVGRSMRKTRRSIDRDLTLRPGVVSKFPRQRQPPFLRILPAGISRLSFQYIKGYFPHSGILARHILVNAWHANWGKLTRVSWWVLGLVLGKSRRNAWFANLARADVVRGCSSSLNRNQQHVSHDSGTPCPKSRALSGTRLSVQGLPPLITTHPDRNVESVSPWSASTTHPLARSVQLWAKFSFALILALGLAVRDGPESLMCDCPRRDQHQNDNTINSPSLDPPIRITRKRTPLSTPHHDANIDTDEDNAQKRF